MRGKSGIADELDITCLAAWTAPGQVRALIQYRLAEWGLPHLLDDAQLVAAELVSNAVRCRPSGQIRVQFRRDGATTLLAVWDSSDAMPVLTPVTELTLEDIQPDAQALDPGHDARAGGWGLPIVQALSAECGVWRTRPHGKWVWSRLAV